MSATRHRSDGHEEIVALDALPLSAAIRRRELSCREVMQAYLAQIERFNPRVNAIVSLQAESRLLAQADERDRQLARGEWLAGCTACRRRSGPRRHLRHSYHPGFAAVRRAGAGARRNRRRAGEEQRCDRHRQDQRTGVRARLADLQPAVRHHPQCLRSGADRRRQQRWGGGGAGAAHAAGGRRQRHDGFAAQPRRLQQRLASARPRDGCRTARKRNCSFSNWPPKARWGAAWPTWPGCWPPRPATIRAVRCRCATIRAGSPTTSGATSAEPGSAGSATTPATCRWRRACWSFAKPRWAISPSWAATSRRACRTIPWSACGAPGWSIASGWCRARLASFTPIPHGASDSPEAQWEVESGSASAPPRSIAPRWIAATGIGRWRVCSNVTISSCCPAPRCFLSMQKRRGRGRSPGGRWTPITAGWRW